MATETLATRYGLGKQPLRKRIRWWLFRQRDRLYRRLLRGKGGTLANGVRWWLDYPRYPDEQDKQRAYLTLYFSDPRASGVMAGAYRMKTYLNVRDAESTYQDGLVEHARKMGLRQLEPAEPDDPDGFFVKWKR